MVKSTGGAVVFTDSLGGYSIKVAEPDSVSFSYLNKPTMKFPVKSISNYTQFDIALRVHLTSKYKPLKEIYIFSKSHKEDSLESRLQYANVYGFHKGGIKSTYTDGSPPGLDVDELINIFRFRHNKQMQAFQRRLIAEEQERYVNYRFNPTLIKRITGLTGTDLERYKSQYRPSYAFAVASNELQFYEYLLNTSYQFRNQNGLPPLSAQ